MNYRSKSPNVRLYIAKMILVYLLKTGVPPLRYLVSICVSIGSSLNYLCHWNQGARQYCLSQNDGIRIHEPKTDIQAQETLYSRQQNQIVSLLLPRI